VHPLDPIRLRDLTPAARREERRLRASELADGSCNLLDDSDRTASTGLHPRLLGVFSGVSEPIEATDIHISQRVTKDIR